MASIEDIVARMRRKAKPYQVRQVLLAIERLEAKRDESS